jgi:VWFA-related protein
MPSVFFACLFLVFCNFGLAQPAKPENARLRKREKIPEERISGKTELDDMVRVETNLIVSEVLVLDERGEPVTGLRPNDFIVKEDDKLQQITVFSFSSSEVVPRSIILIIDYSGSQLPYIKTSIEAAKLLVDKLPPQDRMAVVTDDVQLIQDFTGDKSLLKTRLESLKTDALAGRHGQSRQYSALMKVLNETAANTSRRPIIIFQTDGDELIKLKDALSNGYTVENGAADFRFADVLKAVETTGATLYSIIPGVRFVGIPQDRVFERAKTEAVNIETAYAALHEKPFDPKDLKLTAKYLKSIAAARLRQQSALTVIARKTSGSAFHLETPDQAEMIYSEILSKMNVRYLIGYYPTNQNRDGKRRNISIKLPNYRQYEIRGRKTYIMGKK